MPLLFAILDEGGRTLSVKTQGDIQTPSFPTLGLLCSIASFGSSKGYTVQTFGTENVQIVYEGFQNHLLLVLATSNMLVSRQLLHGLLQAVYAGIQLWVGRALLASLEMRGVEQLRRHLRSMAWIEPLVTHDAQFPCTMLPGPQWLGLAPEDKAVLTVALEGVAGAVPTPLAALTRDHLYVAATPAWLSGLSSQQQLLLQHLASHLGPKGGAWGAHSEAQVHVSAERGAPEQAMRLVMVLLPEGATLLLLLNHSSLTLDSVRSAVAQHLPTLEPLLQTPISCLLLPPQFSSAAYDVAAVVRHAAPNQGASVTLLWGHRRFAGGGAHGASQAQGGGVQNFNPMSSPTVRKQMHQGPASAASFTRRTLSSSGSVNAEAMHLFFKASCDLLVAFMLHCSHTTPMAAAPAAGHLPSKASALPDAAAAADASAADALRASLQSRPSNPGSDMATPRSAMAAFAQRFFSTFRARGEGGGGGLSGASTPRHRPSSGLNPSAHGPTLSAFRPTSTLAPYMDVQESQMLAEGKRLVAVVDPNPSASVSVFMACSGSTERLAASQAARELRALAKSGATVWER